MWANARDYREGQLFSYFLIEKYKLIQDTHFNFIIYG